MFSASGTRPADDCAFDSGELSHRRLSSTSTPDERPSAAASWKTAKRTVPIVFDDTGSVDLGCVGFTEDNLRMVNLPPGDYVLSGSHFSSSSSRAAADPPSKQFGVYFALNAGPCTANDAKRCVEVFTHSQTDGRGKEKDHFCKDDGDRPNGLFDFSTSRQRSLVWTASCRESWPV